MSLDINLTNVESTTNKKTTLTDNSDTFYPTQKAVKTAVDLKVDANANITGATKTKITYDAKGLVTSGADATTADIADSSNKRYVTDANLTVLGNTSGTNTGDQDLSGYVQDSDFTSHSILAKQSGASDPVAVSIGNNEILGRKSGGGSNIEGLSVSDVKSILDLSGTNTGDQTFLNARVQTVASSATVTATSTNDIVTITAQAVGLTLANPTGTFSEGQSLIFRIKDDSTPRTIGYGGNFRAIGVTAPITTVANKTTYIGCIYNSTDSKFDIVGVCTEA